MQNYDSEFVFVPLVYNPVFAATGIFTQNIFFKNLVDADEFTVKNLTYSHTVANTNKFINLTSNIIRPIDTQRINYQQDKLIAVYMETLN